MLGKLFVFEGPDGTGKSTLAQKFADYINSSGDKCNYLAFPGREPASLGHHIYELHHEPGKFGINTIDQTSLQLLHIAAHIDAIKGLILPILAKGHHIALDRFWWSTWVYGTVTGVDNQTLTSMIDLEKSVWQGVLPAAIFLVTRRTPLRKEPGEKWKKLTVVYRELAVDERKLYPVVEVSNDGTVTEALNEITTAISNLKKYKEASLRRSHPQKSPRKKERKADLIKTPDAKVTGSISSLPLFMSHLLPARPSEVYDTYWKFAAERQAIFFRKLRGCPPPWTTDPIFEKHKFTNAYRASDRVSQFLIRHVIYEGEQLPQEVFFRIILFKIFNRIETWEMLQKNLGPIQYSSYSFEGYNDILLKAMAEGETIFSAAYIMPSGVFGHPKKHQNYLRLLEKMMEDEVPTQIASARTMRAVFELIRSYPLMGDFLAYQYTIDINYSNLTNFSEMELVVPGPGARDGIRKCFENLGGLNEIDIICLMAERQDQEFTRLGLEFQNLFGRPLQLIDCQNLFCEVDKYARLAHPNVKGKSGRTRIKQIYHVNSEPVEYWYPPKWGLNHLISQQGVEDDSRI